MLTSRDREETMQTIQSDKLIPMTRAATHYNEVRRSENRSDGPTAEVYADETLVGREEVEHGHMLIQVSRASQDGMAGVWLGYRFVPTDPRNLAWVAGERFVADDDDAYVRLYGSDTIAAFRNGERSARREEFAGHFAYPLFDYPKAMEKAA